MSTTRARRNGWRARTVKTFANAVSAPGTRSCTIAPMTNKHKLVTFLQGMLTVAPSDDTLLALSAALTAVDELVPGNFAIAARELLEYMRRDTKGLTTQNGRTGFPR